MAFVVGSPLPETLTGTNGADSLFGLDGNDRLVGRRGDDYLDGGAGKDRMIGGEGNDVYIVDRSNDQVIEERNEGTDLVIARDDFVLSAHVENLTLDEVGRGESVGYYTNFQSFATGSIDGQQGWDNYGPARDEEIVNLGGVHGKVWRISNEDPNGDFGGPYSPGLAATAGELGFTTADSNRIVASFSFKPVQNAADGSRVEIDFGNEDSSDRNNYLVLEHTGEPGIGLRLAVNEPLANGDWGNNSFDWATGNRDLATNIDSSQWHTISLELNFVDGTDNDVINVYLDGVLVGQTTTFENYRDFHLGNDHTANAEANQVNRLLFRVGEPTGLAGDFPEDGAGGNRQGFYIDDLGYQITAPDGDAPEVGTGNGLDNRIIGNSIGNTLSGMGGDDVLEGRDGNDVLNGGAGFDFLTGGAGNDRFLFDAAGTSAVPEEDAITDFTFGVIGEGKDVIDLRTFDAQLVSTTQITVVNEGAVSGLGSNIKTVYVDLNNDGAGNNLTHSEIVIYVNAGLGGFVRNFAIAENSNPNADILI